MLSHHSGSPTAHEEGVWQSACVVMCRVLQPHHGTGSDFHAQLLKRQRGQGRYVADGRQTPRVPAFRRILQKTPACDSGTWAPPLKE